MEQGKGYQVNLDLGKCDVRFWADGDCMNTPKAPIRIKNGQRLMAHRYNDFNPYADIASVTGKVCVIVYQVEGKRYAAVKEMVGLDEIAGTLRLKYYYPEETIVSLKIDGLEAIYIVDGVTD